MMRLTIFEGLRGRTFPKLALALVAAIAVAAGLLLKTAPEASGAPELRTVETGATGVQVASGELIVTYAPQATVREVQKTNRQRGGITMRIIPQLNARVLSFPEIKALDSRAQRIQAMIRMKQRYQSDPLVDLADFNYRNRGGRVTTSQASLSRTESGGSFGKAWGLSKIEADRAWRITRGGGGEIAVVDSGIDASHPDLSSNIVAQRDFVNGDAVAEDTIGHGTHVAGIAAASDNGQPSLGVCPSCGIIAAKVTGDDGLAYDSTIAEAIVWSADQGADAINVSISSGVRSKTVQRAVEYAWKKDAIVVAAAGNEAANAASYPASFGRAMSVSSTDEKDRLRPTSNYGRWVDVAAPGQGILSTAPGNNYTYLDGTSMSTGFVTGLAGLLVSQGMTAPEIRNQIEATADDLGKPGRDWLYGSGRVNAASAVGMQEPIPRITNVKAHTATPGERLGFYVEGSHYRTGARVLLKNGTRTIEAAWSQVVFSDAISTRADIPASVRSGTVWDVVVVNPEGQRARYPDAVEVG